MIPIRKIWNLETIKAVEMKMNKQPSGQMSIEQINAQCAGLMSRFDSGLKLKRTPWWKLLRNKLRRKTSVWVDTETTGLELKLAAAYAAEDVDRSLDMYSTLAEEFGKDRKVIKNDAFFYMYSSKKDQKADETSIDYLRRKLQSLYGT